MELWFWFAIAGGVLGGVPSFMLKIAAQRKYNPELFILYGALSSAVLLLPITLFFSGIDNLNWLMIGVAALAGVVTSLGGVVRIIALTCIDTTIFYPLLKVLSPALAIVFGVLFFSESFTLVEWGGLLLGVLVPLLLISKVESSRQNNLALGLILVVFTGALSAIISAVNKYVTDQYNDPLWIMTAAATGIFVGAIFLILRKQGIRKFFFHIRSDTTKAACVLALVRGVVISISFGCIIYAFAFGGTLAVVHTIHSLYILVPIVLSIIFYNEHWNTQKIIAIILSIAALTLLG